MSWLFPRKLPLHCTGLYSLKEIPLAQICSLGLSIHVFDSVIVFISSFLLILVYLFKFWTQ